GADVVWVSGGSLVALLAVWRAHGLDDVLRAAWRAGVVLAGGSAGGICWHTGGVTQSFGPEPVAVADGLGFVPGSLGVHTDSDPRRLPAFRAAIKAGHLAEGIAIDEGMGLVYRDRELVEAVTERPGGRAIRISASAPDIELPVRTLREDTV
ncbi:MAG TPA: Type 1 glutamine amidotransferase-like domain-containing protein, partial [Micromonosporaceae bacterium]